MSEKKGWPWWGTAIIAGGAVLGGAYVLYEAVAVPLSAPSKASTAELAYWSQEYSKELSDIEAQNRLPTAAEEYALSQKQKQIDEAYNTLYSVYGVAQTVLLGAMVVAGAVYLISKLAKAYLDSRGKSAKTPAEAVQSLRVAHSLDVYESGNISLSLALNTQTDTIFSSLYTPLLESEVSSLQVSTATLIGTQLQLTQVLISNLNIALESSIPALLEEATAILSHMPI